MEHRAINALLNPHFIFNSISNIQNLVNQSNRAEATEYLAILSRLIRQNLENLKHNLVPLSSELALIERYIQLQNLRFNHNIFLSVEVRQLAPDEYFIPPLLLQSFVENAVIHGFRARNTRFNIELLITLKNNYLVITITDDGIGFADSVNQTTPTERSSMGIVFNRKRLKRLSDFYKLNQYIEIENLSRESKTGTRVTIVISAGLKKVFDQKSVFME